MSDLCFKPTAPVIEGEWGNMVNFLLDRIIPCIVISPLDCFWEGSKPLGPNPPIEMPDYFLFFLPTGTIEKNMTWANLNPQRILDELTELEGLIGDMRGVHSLFKRMGINDGYQSKPCLDPFDPGCPKIAPNYRSNKTVDYGAVMSKGCHGIARNIMEWPKELILGGYKMENNQIVR